MADEFKAIDSEEDWETASLELLEIVNQRKEIADHWEEQVRATRANYKAATLGRDVLDKPLKEREGILRKSLSLFKAQGNDSFGVREKVEFFVEDESLIPRKFMQPNEKLIKEVVESMGVMTHIPGIGTAQRYPVYIRTKKESK